MVRSITLLLLAAAAGTAWAKPSTREERGLAREPAADPAPPCEDCVVVPPSAEGRPLIVLLHGDEQPPSAMVEPFKKLAQDRDIALFAPSCPEKLGCDRKSFWRWNGDGAWLLAHVDALVETYHLDTRRLWIVGWSGGAAYAGFQLPLFAKRFAAFVMVGGASPGPGCIDRKVPIFVLSGNKNRVHDLMVWSYERLHDCKHAVTWTLLKDKDHDDEWHILEQADTQRTVFDFLAKYTLKK